jgi:transcriptional regulator with XRE-family HTH domain
MRDLDKGAMGRRIRQIRLGASLRQWELAKLLGTTQSAVHKYEHGVVPEPRRLVELARIGGTSVEWVLTGTHWENGSSEQERIDPELLDTACMLREISKEGRDTVDDALRIVREAVAALERGEFELDRADPQAVVESLQHHSAGTLQLLESAWRIQRAVLKRVAEEYAQRLDHSKVISRRRAEVEEGNDPNPAAGPTSP